MSWASVLIYAGFIASAYAADVENPASTPTSLVKEEVQEDAVEVMKAAYLKGFTKLPALRNCTPQDAEGLWKQSDVWAAANSPALEIFKKEGADYILFSTHNRFAQKRSQKEVTRAHMQRVIGENLQQYIVNIKGVLYVYENYALKDAKLCFVTTESKNKIAENTLLLAEPLALEKPLVAYFYTKITALGKKEAKDGR